MLICMFINIPTIYLQHLPPLPDFWKKKHNFEEKRELPNINTRNLNLFLKESAICFNIETHNSTVICKYILKLLEHKPIFLAPYHYWNSSYFPQSLQVSAMAVTTSMLVTASSHLSGLSALTGNTPSPLHRKLNTWLRVVTCKLVLLTILTLGSATLLMQPALCTLLSVSCVIWPQGSISVTFNIRYFNSYILTKQLKYNLFTNISFVSSVPIPNLSQSDDHKRCSPDRTLQSITRTSLQQVNH